MARFWRSLIGRAQTSAYSPSEYAADLQFSFGGASYPLGVSSQAWSRTEDVETSFTGYVQAAYKSSGPIFAVILARLLLFTEGRFCWFEVNDDGGDGVSAGRVGLDVLENPWPNGGTAELLARMEQDVSLGGNFFAVLEPGSPDRLRRLRPDWLTIVLTAPPALAVQSDVAGYWYHPGRSFMHVSDPGPDDQIYTTSDVCHWSPIPDPEAQYRGMSWLTPVIREVQADKAATRHKQAFFDNGATLGAVISARENLTDEQFEKFIARFNAAHQGTDNAYRPLFFASPVDTTVTTADMRQLDFKVTQGAGETRLCAAGGVPPIIVGLSEGLASATYSNYGMARRKFGDHWGSPQWRSAAHALSNIVTAPRDGLRLGVNTSDIPFLREDQADAATIQQTKAITIKQYIDAGFKPDSVVAAVDADDRSLLEHTGLYSVQLLPPTSVQRLPARTLTGQLSKEAMAPADQQAAAEAAGAAEADSKPAGTARADFNPDRHPRHATGQYQALADHMGVVLAQWVAEGGTGDPLAGFDRQQLVTAAKACGIDVPRGASADQVARLLLAHMHQQAMSDAMPADAGRAVTPSGIHGAEQLHAYWTRGEGLARWAESPKPWTTLYGHLLKYLPPEEAKRTAAEWFHDVFGFWPGADANRVAHGKPPRGDRVGPG